MLVDEVALLLSDPVSIDITCKAVGDFRPTLRSIDIKSTAIENFRATPRGMDNPLTSRTNSEIQHQKKKNLHFCIYHLDSCVHDT
jgi:hypothetical protein